jgi:hypothetical protein
LLGQAETESAEVLAWGIFLLFYFNIYFYLLQFSVPAMLLLLGIEPFLIFIVYLSLIIKRDALWTAYVLLIYTGPILHIIYMELLYQLRKKLATLEPEESVANEAA